MSKKLSSQEYLFEHSKAKVELLGKYLDKYLNVIANDRFTKKIYVFDLFCGQGDYPKGGEGSPLIILRAIQRLHNLNVAKNSKIPKIDLIFNEKIKEKTVILKKAIQYKNLHNPNFGKLEFRNYDYKDLVAKLHKFVPNLKKEKAFIFIDPYGYKDVRVNEIKKLLEGNNSEILLWLPAQFMYRFYEKGRPPALHDFLSELVDFDRWNSTSIWSFLKELKIGFKKSIGDQYFVDTFSIEKDSKTVFCLFFFSSHIRGFEKMLEAKWEIDNENGKGWSYEKTIGMFASLKTNELETLLMEFLNESEKSNGEIYEFTLRNGFLPKHTVEIFKSLQDRNKLVVKSNKKPTLRKGAFYINYENYRNDYNRVQFKI